jgi:hypothetical protein
MVLPNYVRPRDEGKNKRHSKYRETVMHNLINFGVPLSAEAFVLYPANTSCQICPLIEISSRSTKIP